MAAWTDKGHTRRINQDGILLQQASEGGWECVLAAVCDGLGGLQKGELASAEVIRGLAGGFGQNGRASGSRQAARRRF